MSIDNSIFAKYRMANTEPRPTDYVDNIVFNQMRSPVTSSQSIFDRFRNNEEFWDNKMIPTRLYQNQEKYEIDRRTQRRIKEDFIDCHGTACEYFSTSFYSNDFFQEDGNIKIDRCFDVMIQFPNLAKITRDYTNFGFYDNQELVGNLSFRHFQIRCRNTKFPRLDQHKVRDGLDYEHLNIDLDKLEPYVGDYIRLKIGDGRYLYRISKVWAPIDNLQGLHYWELTLQPYVQDNSTSIYNPDTGQYEDINLGGVNGNGTSLNPDANAPSQGDGTAGGVDIIIDGNITQITPDDLLPNGEFKPGRHPGIRLHKDKNPDQINERKRLKNPPLQNSGGTKEEYKDKGGWFVEDSRITQQQIEQEIDDQLSGS